MTYQSASCLSSLSVKPVCHASSTYFLAMAREGAAITNLMQLHTISNCHHLGSTIRSEPGGLVKSYCTMIVVQNP